MAAGLSCQKHRRITPQVATVQSGLVCVHRSQLPGSGCRTLVSLRVVRRPAQANVASEDILLGASSMKYVWIVMD